MAKGQRSLIIPVVHFLGIGRNCRVLVCVSANITKILANTLINNHIVLLTKYHKYQKKISLKSNNINKNDRIRKQNLSRELKFSNKNNTM